MPTWNTRFNSRAQLMRPGKARACSTSHSAAAATASLAGPSSVAGPCGTASARRFAFGASTLWFAQGGRSLCAAKLCVHQTE
jgi:hypothetical protein